MVLDVCGVCHDKFGRYKCPRCLDVMYCSVACHKAHKETCAPTPAVEEAKARKGKRSRKDPEAPFPGDDEPNTMLTRRQLHALASDPRVANEVKTTELQALLKVVDGSRSRIDALETAIHNVPEFASFVQNILRIIWMNAE